VIRQLPRALSPTPRRGRRLFCARGRLGQHHGRPAVDRLPRRPEPRPRAQREEGLVAAAQACKGRSTRLQEGCTQHFAEDTVAASRVVVHCCINRLLRIYCQWMSVDMFVARASHHSLAALLLKRLPILPSPICCKSSFPFDCLPVREGVLLFPAASRCLLPVAHTHALVLTLLRLRQ